MKKLRFFLVITVIFGLLSFIQASDLSKIKFHDAYLFDENVQLAIERGAVDGKIANYLMDETVGIDIKAAIINALSWEGSIPNLSTFRMFLGRKYQVNESNLNIDNLTADEQFCLGYMTFLNDATDSGKAAAIIEKAKTQLPNSFTINIILSMAKANIAVEKGDWCAAWTTCEKVLNNASLSIDMESSAVDAIKSGLENLKEKCN
jgi:hypothetical protein